MPAEASVRYGPIGFGRIGRRLAERLAGSAVTLAAVPVRPLDRALVEVLAPAGRS